MPNILLMCCFLLASSYHCSFLPHPPPPQTTLRAEPYDIQFSHVKSDSQSSEETTVSVVIGHKTLFLYDMDNADNPIELAFQPRYGEITTYKW